jgi:2-dehydro-3-deoxyglucarate aldolase
VQEAIGRVRQACLASGVALGIFGVTAEAVQPYIAQGYTLIVAGVDTLMLGAQAQAIVDQLSK